MAYSYWQHPRSKNFYRVDDILMEVDVTGDLAKPQWINSAFIPSQVCAPDFTRLLHDPSDELESFFDQFESEDERAFAETVYMQTGDYSAAKAAIEALRKHVWVPKNDRDAEVFQHENAVRDLLDMVADKDAEIDTLTEQRDAYSAELAKAKEQIAEDASSMYYFGSPRRGKTYPGPVVTTSSTTPTSLKGLAAGGYVITPSPSSSYSSATELYDMLFGPGTAKNFTSAFDKFSGAMGEFSSEVTKYAESVEDLAEAVSETTKKPIWASDYKESTKRKRVRKPKAPTRKSTVYHTGLDFPRPAAREVKPTSVLDNYAEDVANIFLPKGEKVEVLSRSHATWYDARKGRNAESTALLTDDNDYFN